ncbi:MAG TPA: hypothetical protein VJT72_22935 [Pseudonocardiaceae bacterium]|nr:hypothetical protein [Pseudonocardiaceae bacterium]
MYGTRDEAVPVSPPFEIVLRGFDRQQVINHVDALTTRVVTIEAERDTAQQRVADLTEQLERLRRESAQAAAQIDRLRREAMEAAAEVDRLQRSPLAAASARIQRMLQMAEDEAAELQLSTEQETTSLRDDARAEADQLLYETRQQCERLEVDTADQCQQVELESERRRLAAEQRAERDIARRRAETEAWISDYQTRGIAALYMILQLAAQRLGSRTIEVKRQATALKRLRAEVTDQVSAVHHLLVEAVGLVDPPSVAEHAEEVRPSRTAEPSETAEFSLHP